MTERPSLKYDSAAAFVQDIEVSKRFYTEVLGLTIALDLGKDVILEGGITLWEIAPTHIIPERLGMDALSTRAANRFEFYFETEDIEGVCRSVEASGAEFLHTLHEEPWGQRTVRFFDPDRHLIEVGESMETFVKRLSASGMTPEQVARKTSVPLEKVKELLGG